MSLNPFDRIRKSEKRLAVGRGLIRRVAAKTGMSRAEVSRTFSGVTKVPNPRLIRAIRLELNAILEEEKIHAS